MVSPDYRDQPAGMSAVLHGRLPFPKVARWLCLLGAIGLVAIISFASNSRGADAGGAFTVTRIDDPTPDGCAPNDCSLREAVLATNALPGSGTITLPVGNYVLTRAGADENAAVTGDLDITGSVTIDGASAATTIIDGGDIDRLFHVFGGATAQVSGITLQNGDSGAGDGGAAQNFGTLTLTDVVLSQNVADDGGAIDNIGTLILNTSKVLGNMAGDAAGGIQGQGGSTLTLTNSTISGNQAGQAGGGISVVSGVVNALGTTISGNTAGGQGGGALLLGTTSFANVTISGNNVLGFDGGGLSISAPVTLNNVTISGNSSGPSGAGGGVHVGVLGTVSTTNSIIANNPSGGDCSGTIISGGHNIDSDGTCGLAGTGDLPNTSPLLGPLALNLGLTQTHALLANSPAMDAGDASTCAANDQRGVSRPLDADGDTTAICDIGALEAGPLDADSDGCSDEREAQTLQGSQISGGLRNANHFWDFFDVPAGGSLLRDQSVSALDIFAVIGRFNSTGDSNIPPLSAPPPAPAYHTAYDRGALVGQDVWDLGPADGSVAATDIFAILGQFNHACV